MWVKISMSRKLSPIWYLDIVFDQPGCTVNCSYWLTSIIDLCHCLGDTHYTRNAYACWIRVLLFIYFFLHPASKFPWISMDIHGTGSDQTSRVSKPCKSFEWFWGLSGRVRAFCTRFFFFLFDHYDSVTKLPETLIGVSTPRHEHACQLSYRYGSKRRFSGWFQTRTRYAFRVRARTRFPYALFFRRSIAFDSESLWRKSNHQ